MSFFDATCPKCKKRFGWSGELIDKPTCPKCGHRDDPAGLQKAADEMAKWKEELFSDKTGGT